MEFAQIAPLTRTEGGQVHVGLAGSFSYRLFGD
jgi:hypothetical protein